MRFSQTLRLTSSSPSEGSGLPVGRLHNDDVGSRSSIGTAMTALAPREPSRLRKLVKAARVVVVGASVPALMRLPLARLARVLEPVGEVTPADDPPAAIEQTLNLVDAALVRARPLAREGCLTRSVTRYWFLRRAGVDVALVFGTGSIDGEIQAHCWLSYADEPLREPEEATAFVELVRIVRPGTLIGKS